MYIFYQYIDYSMQFWVFYSLVSPPLLSQAHSKTIEGLGADNKDYHVYNYFYMRN